MDQINYRIDLYKLLPENATTCECGVAEAYFSAEICRWPNVIKHYCVDAWATLPVFGDGGFNEEWHQKNYDAAMERLQPFIHKITILRGVTSEMAYRVADNELDLLYLDADHSYAGVMKDLEAWWPKVKTGGIVAGHDFLNWAFGVNMAVREFANSRGIEVNTIIENKAEDAGFWFKKL